MTAMAGLLFAGNPIFVGFGIGTMLVVGVAMLGSLTFLPAMLSFLGEKNWLKGRVPYVTKRRHQSKGESRVWGTMLTRVLKRPLLSTVLAGGLLVALHPDARHPVQGARLRGLLAQPARHPDLDRPSRAASPGGAVPATTVIKAKDVAGCRPSGGSNSCATRRSPSRL